MRMNTIQSLKYQRKQNIREIGWLNKKSSKNDPKTKEYSCIRTPFNH